MKEKVKIAEDLVSERKRKRKSNQNENSSRTSQPNQDFPFEKNLAARNIIKEHYVHFFEEDLQVLCSFYDKKKNEISSSRILLKCAQQYHQNLDFLLSQVLSAEKLCQFLPTKKNHMRENFKLLLKGEFPSVYPNFET